MTRPVLDRPFQLEIGPYRLLLPRHAIASAKLSDLIPGAYQSTWTQWTIVIGRFHFLIHLDAIQGLDDLKSFIDFTTKSNVVTPSVVINGVPGVTYGGYLATGTWIDWWFKKGDVMICLCLQSVDFSVIQPTAVEREEHQAVINSLKYARDFPSEDPPAWVE